CPLPSSATPPRLSCFFSLNRTATPEPSTLSLHDALPICSVQAHLDLQVALRAAVIGARAGRGSGEGVADRAAAGRRLLRQQTDRSEEHTSELQSRRDLVCRLLLEKKKNSRQDADESRRDQ